MILVNPNYFLLNSSNFKSTFNCKLKFIDSYNFDDVDLIFKYFEFDIQELRIMKYTNTQ